MPDEQSTTNKFKNIMDYARAMHHRYYRAFSAFHAYETLREAIAINTVGKLRAEENAKIIGDFRGFFFPAQEALRIYFFIELAKMFDSSQQALHINKILNFAESNLKDLTAEAFTEYNQDQSRVFIEELATNYRGIAYSDLVMLRDKINKHKNTINNLKTYRDKWLAHDDINKPEVPPITGEEIRDLFDILETILNFITGELNSESWTYSQAKDDAKHHTTLVIDYLRRFEPYRRREIENELNEEMKKYKTKESI